MFGERMMPKAEQEPNSNQHGMFAKAEELLKSFKIPATAKRTIMIMLGTAVLNAGTARAENEFKLEKNTQQESIVSKTMHDKIATSKGEMATKRVSFFNDAANKMGLDAGNIVEIYSFISSSEGINEKGKYETIASSENIAKEGNDVCFSTYDTLGVVEENKGNESMLWSYYAGEYKAYNLNEAKIISSSAPIPFSGKGISENLAILKSLEKAANMQNGEIVSGNIESQKEENNSDFSSVYTKNVGSGQMACMDNYRVIKVSKNSDGFYEATVEVVFGKIVQ